MTDEPVEAITRIRSRTAPAVVVEGTGRGIAPRSSPAAAVTEDGSWMKTGAAARETGQSELAKNQERERKRAEGIYMPYRFWLQTGKNTEIVILDSLPGPSFYEHQLQDPRTGKWDIYESCPKESEVCPLCDGAGGGKDSYYIMMLTAMVMDPFINKNGVTIPHSRKLLAIKTNEQAFFLRQFDTHGTLRGLQFLMTRDSKQTPNTGRAELVGTAPHSEADILATFGHPAVTDNTGKVLKQANAECYAFPYAKLFPRPSGDDLRHRYGGLAPMGSTQSNAAAANTSGGSTIRSRGSAAVGDDLTDDDVPF